jgi:hypothetical protein
MASVVDAFPLPFDAPEVQELHSTLAAIYPTSNGAMFVADRAGMNPAMLFPGQPAFLLWYDILKEAARAQLTRKLVTVVRDLNSTNARRPFLEALLNDTAPPTEHQPRDANGAPSFITSTDNVTEEEALLFRDDLTLEIGRVPWLIAVLQRLIQASPSVCRLAVGWAGKSGWGTGFRIAQDLVLTNWHVFHSAGVKAEKVAAEFGYDDDGKGGGLASTSYGCDVGSIRGAAVDDWAIVTVTDAIPDIIPVLKLSEAANPTQASQAFILQHPLGGRKRVAFVRNQVTFVSDRVVQYLSDTQQGSSGSPVLDEQGRLVALHHAGGRPQEIAGKTPLRKNEGIRIPRIVAGLQRLGVAIP